jgi:hypothetical protein
MQPLQGAHKGSPLPAGHQRFKSTKVRSYYDDYAVIMTAVTEGLLAGGTWTRSSYW